VNNIEKQEKAIIVKVKIILKKLVEFFVFNNTRKIKPVKNKIESIVNLKIMW
jgi:hypothetical protein